MEISGGSSEARLLPSTKRPPHRATLASNCCCQLDKVYAYSPNRTTLPRKPVVHHPPVRPSVRQYDLPFRPISPVDKVSCIQPSTRRSNDPTSLITQPQAASQPAAPPALPARKLFEALNSHFSTPFCEQQASHTLGLCQSLPDCHTSPATSPTPRARDSSKPP